MLTLLCFLVENIRHRLGRSGTSAQTSANPIQDGRRNGHVGVSAQRTAHTLNLLRGPEDREIWLKEITLASRAPSENKGHSLKKERKQKVDTDALHPRLRDRTATGKSKCEEREKAEERGNRRECTRGIEHGIKFRSTIGTIDMDCVGTSD